MTSAPSLPHILREHARCRPDAVALRRKHFGIWEETTWGALNERVARVAVGLQRLGVGPGAGVAVLGDATLDWIAADLATQALGARVVAAWPRLDAETLRHDLARAGVTFAVCADQEQVDKLAGTGLTVLVVDPTGLGGEGYEHTLDAVAESGAVGGYDELLDLRTPDDEVAVSFDARRGRDAVVHRAGQLVAAAQTVAEHGGLTSADRTLVVVPPASLPARVHDIYAAVIAGAVCHVPESAASVPVDLEEVRPTVLALSPRALELLRAGAELRAARSRRVKGRVLRWGSTRDGALARHGVLRPMARRMGIDAVRRITAVGGPATDELRRFYAQLGAPVVVLDGPSATGGLALADGIALPGVEADVDADGALVVRAPWSGAPLDTDRRAPRLLARPRRDGGIELLGALEDVAGEVVLPQLEARLRDSPYLTEALVLVGAGGGLTARVGLDVDAVGVWAAQHDVYAATLLALAEHPDVVALAQAEVIRLLGAGTVAEVTVVPRRLREEDGELSPLLDVRRPQPDAVTA